MLQKRHRYWLLFAVMLLIMATVACDAGPQVQEWLDRQQAALSQRIRDWAQDQLDRMVAEARQRIDEWWNSLLQDSQRKLTDTWRAIGQGWGDFWASIRPPAPVITDPSDGFIAAGANITVRGTVLPESTVTLYRNDQYFRETTADSTGRWIMEGVMISKGESSLKARAKRWLLFGPFSKPIRVSFAGAELGSAPEMTPVFASDLNPPAWMLEFALERLKTDGRTFYEEDRQVYTEALRKGLRASADDDIGHHFINPDKPLGFDAHLLVFLAPKEMPTAEIVETLAESVEATVIGKGVRTEIMQQISGSLERLDVVWAPGVQSGIPEWQYVSIEFDASYLKANFDPSSLARFKTSLISGFVSNLGGELTGAAAENIVKLAFAVWGQADADQQASHYFDLAVRAWNQRSLDGQIIKWDDASANGFDGVTGYNFATNQEWAMFYLGRALFYVQSVADPYYTIPFYTPDSQLWAGYAHRLVAEVAGERLKKVAAAKLGTVVGGGGLLTALFVADTIFEWMQPYWRYLDAREIRDQHRPNFAAFVAGSQFEAPMPEDLKQLGAGTDRVGYPYRGPADLLLHRFLGASDASVEERTNDPITQFDAFHALPPITEQALLGSAGDPASMTRGIAQRSSQFVHSGNFIQADRRVPEGDMIFPNAYLLREVYACQRLDGSGGPWWETEVGTRLRLTLLDGSVVEGIVAYQPGGPIDQQYMDGQHYLVDVPMRVVGLEEASYLAGPMTSFPFTSLTLMSVAGDEQHLYMVFDAVRALPWDSSMADVPSLATVVIGIAGNRSQPAPFEKDGVAAIGVDRLAVGVWAIESMLKQFADDALAYEPPDPIVCPASALCAALASPATLHIIDRQGRHVGPDAAGGVDLEIPGSRYFTNAESGQQFIVVPKADLGENYTVRVEGDADGVFDLDVFYGDSRRHRAYRHAYEDVPLTDATVAEVAVQAAALLSLRVDEEGDGVFDRELGPTQSYESLIWEPEQGTPVLIWVSAASVLLLVGAVMVVWLRRRRRLQPVPAPAMSLVCSTCGTANRPGSRFCAGCGAAFGSAAPGAITTCPHCGAPAPRTGARFCSRCGKPLW